MRPGFEWDIPIGMEKAVITSWRAFYGRAHDLYGITPAQYRALYLSQQGRCYGCWDKRGIHPDDPKGGGSRRLAVDHNHAYGNRIEAVRGLLCSTGDMSCNRILGAVRDRPEALERLAHVLRAMPAQSVLRSLAHGDGDEQIEGMAYRILT